MNTRTHMCAHVYEYVSTLHPAHIVLKEREPWETFEALLSEEGLRVNGLVFWFTVCHSSVEEVQVKRGSGRNYPTSVTGTC